jgi:hypothetical protein
MGNISIDSLFSAFFGDREFGDENDASSKQFILYVLLLFNEINPPGIITDGPFNMKQNIDYLIQFFSLVKKHIPFRYFTAAYKNSPNAKIYAILIQMLISSMHEIAYNRCIGGRPDFSIEKIKSQFQEAITVCALNEGVSENGKTFSTNLPRCGDCISFDKDGNIVFTELKYQETKARKKLGKFVLVENKRNGTDIFDETVLAQTPKIFCAGCIDGIHEDDSNLVFTLPFFCREDKQSKFLRSEKFFVFPRAHYNSVIRMFKRDIYAIWHIEPDLVGLPKFLTDSFQWEKGLGTVNT